MAISLPKTEAFMNVTDFNRQDTPKKSAVHKGSFVWMCIQMRILRGLMFPFLDKYGMVCVVGQSYNSADLWAQRSSWGSQNELSHSMKTANCNCFPFQSQFVSALASPSNLGSRLSFSAALLDVEEMGGIMLPKDSIYRVKAK